MVKLPISAILRRVDAVELGYGGISCHSGLLIEAGMVFSALVWAWLAGPTIVVFPRPLHPLTRPDSIISVDW